MSQNQSNSSVPSNDELEHFNKCQLLSFLKSRGVKQTGNKDVLLKVAKLVANRPVITVTSDHTTSSTINSVLEWKNAATEVAPIPKGFNLEILTNYLREIPCNLAMQDEEELVYSSFIPDCIYNMLSCKHKRTITQIDKMHQCNNCQCAFRIALSCPPFCCVFMP